MLPRSLSKQVLSALKAFPAVAIVGPRQVGKSTLAKSLLSEKSVYLDLEKPDDLLALDHAADFLRQNIDKLICIDEVQRKPELFQLLRSLIDEFDRKPRFILLGSAAPDLLRQSSESLAGRIKYLELTPFNCRETKIEDQKTLWLRGGYPLSFLAPNDEESYLWREALVSSYIERDLPSLGFRRSSSMIRRVWTMLAHYHSEVLNKSKIGQAADLTGEALTGYIEMLEDTFMIRCLPPYHANLKKRLVKSPKIYIRDTGLLHYLLRIKNWSELYKHPSIGGSWESLAIENVLSVIPKDWEASFFRTATGDEVDLVLVHGTKKIAFEFKSSSAPKLTSANLRALDILNPDEAFLVAPTEREYALENGVKVCSLESALGYL